MRQRLALGIGTGAYLVCFFLPWEFCAQILVLFLFKWDCLVDGVASVILISQSTLFINCFHLQTSGHFHVLY